MFFLRECGFVERQYVAFFLVRLLTTQSQHTSGRASERASERPSVRHRVSDRENKMKLTSRLEKADENNE